MRAEGTLGPGMERARLAGQPRDRPCSRAPPATAATPPPAPPPRPAAPPAAAAQRARPGPAGSPPPSAPLLGALRGTARSRQPPSARQRAGVSGRRGFKRRCASTSPTPFPAGRAAGGRGEATHTAHTPRTHRHALTHAETPPPQPLPPPRSCRTCCPAPASPGRRPPVPRWGAGAAGPAHRSANLRHPNLRYPCSTRCPAPTGAKPAQHLPKVYRLSPPVATAQGCRSPSLPPAAR